MNRGRGIKLRHRPRIWVLRHLQAALSSLGRLSRTPLAALMTVAVIAIALALPAGLHLLLQNVQQISNRWDSAATISLFMQQGVDEAKAERTAKKLRAMDEVATVTMISRSDALEEFRQLSGFADALEALDENPLPVVLIVQPAMQHTTPAAVGILVKKLQRQAGVDFAQLDMEWVQRFQAIARIAERGVVVLGSMLALAVLLIVGNTIRLEIQNRHAEIEITKLIGGTNAFIRRPFLYGGLWYGLMGGWLAWILVSVALWLLSGPAEELALLYRSDFGLSSVPISTILTLLAGGGLLGLAGSWVAVGRHLHSIEPS